MAVIINQRILCLHAGIGPRFASRAQIEQITRPLEQSNDLVDSIVWSDPHPEQGFRGNRKRLRGYEFGSVQLAEFLEKNGMRMLIRGHSYVPEGVRYDFDQQVVAVSSASSRGICGVIEIRRAIAELGIHKFDAAGLHTAMPKPESENPIATSRDRTTAKPGCSQSMQSMKPPITMLHKVRQSAMNRLRCHPRRDYFKRASDDFL